MKSPNPIRYIVPRLALTLALLLPLAGRARDAGSLGPEDTLAVVGLGLVVAARRRGREGR